MNDLVRDLALLRERAEVWRSKLQQKLPQQGMKIFIFPSRRKDLPVLFNQKNHSCFCTCFNALMQNLGHVRVDNEWRLFIDWSKVRLKAVHHIRGLKNLPFLRIMLSAWKKVMNRKNSL